VASAGVGLTILFIIPAIVGIPVVAPRQGMFLVVKSMGDRTCDTSEAYKSQGGFFDFAKSLRSPFLRDLALERVDVNPAHATAEASGGTHFTYGFDDTVAASAHIIIVPERTFSIEINLCGAGFTRQPERKAE
jgi:hypothetical protein